MPARPRSRSEAPLDATPPDAAAAPAAPAADEPATPERREGLDDLSFREAQVALELVLSQLQASDLDVEAMVDLHRRGQAYAERCETLLNAVEQEVLLWDPDDPDAAPTPSLPGLP